jgi:hypothetical protein
MIVDKPALCRERLQEKEHDRQGIEQQLRRILEHLNDGECLGEAVRDHDRIVMPILRASERSLPGTDAGSARALIAAWMDGADQAVPPTGSESPAPP